MIFFLKFAPKNLANHRFRRNIYRDNNSVKSQNRRIPTNLNRFVSCERFRPIRRGKYFSSPSIYSLHACYKLGVSFIELERGIYRNNYGDMRYDLGNLYIGCELVFDAGLEEMTDELEIDYRRCKESGALRGRQIKEIEKRFFDFTDGE